jgi:hypothetical protein
MKAKRNDKPTEFKPDAAAVRDFIGYLDKESTVLGVLMAAGGAAFGYLLKECSGKGMFAEPCATRLFGLCATLSVGIAALMFYLQRSHVTWYAGQFARVLCGWGDLSELIDRVSTWCFWLRYRVGFLAVTLAAVFAVLAMIVKTDPSMLEMPLVLASALFATFFAAAILQWLLLRRWDAGP